ncbi:MULTISPECIES: type IV secretion system protein [Sphingomonas]|uniref:type IV secretion system protein n=1 Tax=Sphingomonas TaxID=13687 RepID=UPI000DEEB427|nr:MULTISPECIES: type IV secretion system protein [Sphingomonas]
MSLCESSPESIGFIGSVLRWTDCQAEAFSLGSWQALSAPGSTLSLVLSGFLTLFIALIGYNLLLGQALTVRSGVVAMVKIGAVLALATSWPAYRTLVYDVVVDGPSQLFSELGSRTFASGDDRTLVARLDRIDDALTRLAILGPGYSALINTAPQTEPAVPPPFAGFDSFALGTSRIIYLFTAIGSLGLVRLVGALMLALGPLLVAFLFFDSTRSIFEGWIRVTAGAALAGLGARFALTLQLTMLEPWLTDLIARRQAEQIIPSAPIQLLVITLFFAMLAASLVFASSRIANAFRLAPLLHLLPLGEGEGRSFETSASFKGQATPRLVTLTAGAPGRVSGIAQSITGRERLWSTQSERLISARAVANEEVAARGADGRGRVPLGQSGRNRSRSRSVAGAVERDSRG